MATAAWRRLVPRGAIVSSSTVSRQHESLSTPVARSVAAEEARCGLLCKVSSLPKRAPTAKSVKSNEVANSLGKPIICVIKAQSSDYQLNEVNADGDIAFLHRVPKARWRKIEKNQTMLIEDDSTESFGTPSKSFSPRTQNYGKYVRRMGRVPELAPVLHFNVFRDNHSLAAVTNRLQYEARIQPDAVGFSSSLPGFGCLTQHGTAVGVSEELLPHASRHLNIHPLVFDPRRMHALDELPKLHRPHRGNFFRILLRNVQATAENVESALQRVSSAGFVNYYDVSRFTIAANHTHEIAALAAMGDYFKSVSYATQALAERMPFHGAHFSSYLNASDKASAASSLRAWAASAKSHKLESGTVRFLDALSQVQDFSTSSQELRAVCMLHPQMSSMRYSGGEFLWNAMASQRLLNHGMRVVVGDVVRVNAQGTPVSQCAELIPSYLSSLRTGDDVFRLVVTEEDAKQFNITDVVLPTPYPAGLKRGNQQVYPNSLGSSLADFKRFAMSHKLDYLFEDVHDSNDRLEEVEADDWQQHRRVANNTYRSIVAKPEALRYHMIRDPNSFTSLKSDLFMMQEHLPLHVVTELDPNRVREPSVYNVSEAFAERMASLRRHNQLTGDLSVVVTGFLPRGTDVPVMLREAFDVRHATFSDLLEPAWS